jgi:hypothetical protein
MENSQASRNRISLHLNEQSLQSDIMVHSNQAVLQNGK